MTWNKSECDSSTSQVLKNNKNCDLIHMSFSQCLWVFNQKTVLYICVYLHDLFSKNFTVTVF
jgi:hypothetical protein